MAAPAHRLRAASSDDFECLMRLAHEGLRPHVEPLVGWDQAAHERGFAGVFDTAAVQVVECNGEAVGYLQLLAEADFTLLAGIYLHRDWRGRGLGSALLGTLCAAADNRGRALCLRVHRGNPAQRLYARYGFVRDGETGIQHWMTRAPRTPGERAKDAAHRRRPGPVADPSTQG